jgi:hypothetical protein
MMKNIILSIVVLKTIEIKKAVEKIESFTALLNSEREGGMLVMSYAIANFPALLDDAIATWGATRTAAHLSVSAPTLRRWQTNPAAMSYLTRAGATYLLALMPHAIRRLEEPQRIEQPA